MNVTDTQTSALTHMPRPPKELLATSTFLLKRLGFAAKYRSQDAFEGTGLTAFHYGVLALLEEDPAETQAVIADALGYDRSHLVRLLDELEERDLVVRQRDPGDRRRHVVTLTPDGREMLGRMRAIVREMNDEFLSPLDADQQAQLHALLARLIEYHDPRCAAPDQLRPEPAGE